MEHHTYCHFTKVARSELFLLRARGYTQQEIARTLGKSQSAVSRELSRNARDTGYAPSAAHAKARLRRRMSKYQGMKVAGNAALRRYVADKLPSGWSPEQIAGRLREVDTTLPYASHEAIYTYLYSAYSGGLWRFLRRAGYRRRRRRRVPKGARTPIPHRVPIQERPAYVARNTQYGHFEADRLESGRDSHAAFLVARDRKSGYVVAAPTATRTSDENARMLVRALSSVSRVRTFTYDNDPAFARHEAVNGAFGSHSYFCDAYAAWQKGGIENENGLLREYFPKGSDLGAYPAWFLPEALARLNHRPRKRLRYRTPYEVAVSSGMLKRSSSENKNARRRGYALEG